MLQVLSTVGLGCKAVWNTLLAGRRLLWISSDAGQPTTDHNNPAGFQGAGKDGINTPCNPKPNGCVLHKWAPNAKQKTQNSNGRNPIVALASPP